MAKQTILSCDDPAHSKKGACPEGAGEVQEREYRFGKWFYSMDLCNDADSRGLLTITNFLSPAVAQKRVHIGDATDYKGLAAKWWASQPEPKKKHNYAGKGAFPNKIMEAFENDFADWSEWQLGDEIPKDWEYDDFENTVKYIGEGKI